jgi:hypothetical protein
LLNKYFKMSDTIYRKSPIINTEIDRVEQDDDDFEESYQAREARDANTITGWKFLAIGMMVLSSSLSLLILVMQFIAASKPMGVFVTKGNGEIESLEYMSGNSRSPELVADFARKTMIGIFSWRNTLPEEGNPGVAVGKGKISTTSFRYTFGLSPQFAEAFRPKLADVSKDLTQGNLETVYIISFISKPKEIASGVWSLDIVGNLYFGSITSSAPPPGGNTIQLNRRLTIAAVPPYTLSEASAAYKTPGLANAVARIRAAGLQITNIEPLLR